MKVNIAYFDEKNLDCGLVSHLPTFDIDMDSGEVYVYRGYDLTPALSLKLKELAVQLHSFYIDMEKEKGS